MHTPAMLVPLSCADACQNIIASHPAVLSVAASDMYDQHTALGPANSKCIDIWAPSGGLGVGLTAASPASNSSYANAINRWEWGFGI